MKNINNKQRTIMKIFGTILFSIALILILDLLFNGNKNSIDKKYVGTWMIGYNFYSKEDKDKLLYTFTQELHLNKDGTFYTKEITNPDNGNDNFVSGTFTENEGRLNLKYTQNKEEKVNILILKEDKLCLSTSCDKYYTKDKVENYFSMYNSTVSTNEE